MADPHKRRENEVILLEFAELAADVNCSYVRTFFGLIPKERNRDEVYDYVAASLNLIGRKLEGSGVMVLVESHDSMSSARMLKPLLSRVTSPAVGVLWDMAHTYRDGEELIYSYDVLQAYIRHIHIKDEYKDEVGKIVHCLPGEGMMPIITCRDLMLSKGYRGYFSLEWEKKWHPEMPDLKVALPMYWALMAGSE
jgi:sugar phosphate isomerase/epimerase